MQCNGIGVYPAPAPPPPSLYTPALVTSFAPSLPLFGFGWGGGVLGRVGVGWKGQITPPPPAHGGQARVLDVSGAVLHRSPPCMFLPGYGAWVG